MAVSTVQVINRSPVYLSALPPLSSRSLRTRIVSGSRCPVRVWTAESAPVPPVTVRHAGRRPRPELARPVRVLLSGGGGCFGWIPKQQLPTAPARLLLVPVLAPHLAPVLRSLSGSRREHSVLGGQPQCPPRVRGPVPAPATSVLFAGWPHVALPVVSQFGAQAERQHVVFQQVQ